MSDWGGSTWGTILGFVVGAILGFLLPGVGWAIGASIGAVVGGYVGNAIDPPEGRDVYQEGPRLDRVYSQGADYGAPIFVRKGCTRAAGTMVWTGGIEEHEHHETQEHEDKGGGGGTTVHRTTYTYTSSFAIGLCEAVFGYTVGRIWADGKLIWCNNKDKFGSTSQMIRNLYHNTIEGRTQLYKGATFYDGSEGQEPSSLMESYEGAGNVPAYRGLAFIEFEDMELGNYGNRRPSIEIELLPNTSEEVIELKYSEVIDSTKCLRTICWSKKGLVCIESEGRNTWMRPALFKGLLRRRKWKGSTNYSEGSLTDNYGATPDGRYYVHFYLGDNKIHKFSWKTGQLIYSFDSPYLLNNTALWGNIRIPRYTKFVETSQFLGASEALGWGTVNEFISAKPYTDGDENDQVQIIYWKEWFTGSNMILEEFDLATICGVSSFDRETKRSTWTVGTYGNKYLFLVQYDSKYYLVKVNKSTKNSTWVAADSTHFDPIGTNYQCILDATVNDNGFIYVLRQDSSKIGGGDTITLCEPLTLTPVRYNVGIQKTSDLQTLVDGFLEDAGLSANEYDTSDLSGETYWGYIKDRPMSTVEALSPLFQTHMFDLIEADWQIKAIKRGGGSQETIPTDDLSVHEIGEDMPPALVTTRIPETRLPRSLTLQYSNKNNDYLPGTQAARRIATESINDKELTCPIVMSPNQALQTIEKILSTAWTERENYEFQLGIEYLKLLPCDVITVNNQKMLLQDITFRFPLILECKAVREVTGTYTSDSTADDKEDEQAIPYLPEQVDVFYLDLPCLYDSLRNRPGIYLAAESTSGRWPGAFIFTSQDGGITWTRKETILNAPDMGKMVTAPGTEVSTRWDIGDTINVELFDDSVSLAGSTEESVLSGTNHAAIGSEENGWEIIGFVDATEEADGTWTLSTLLRGRYSTENNIGNAQDGDLFIPLSTADIYFIDLSQSDVSNTRRFRAVTFGTSIQNTSTDLVSIGGNSLKPWSPVHIKGTRNGSDNLTITWIRRPKAMNEWNDYTDVPLLEESEEYEVDIYDGGTVVRTLTTTDDATGVTYTATQQTTDFGSTQSSVSIKVYQKNAVVGRGFPGSATV